MKKNKANYLIKFLIPIGLFFLWLVLLSVQIFLIEKSFTLITHNYDKHVFYAEGQNYVPKSKKLVAKLDSKDNYLGIISINFDSRQEMSDGQMFFRIKEEGASQWYYRNLYNTKQFNELPFYPFGFPIINESKGKTYIVEIELEKENQHNKFIQLDRFGPALALHHKYPKAPLVEDRAVFATFFSRRIANIIENNYQIFASTIYLYPFIFYLLWRVAKNKYSRIGFLVFIFLTACFDALFVFRFIDLAYITISLLWILLLKKLAVPSKITFYAGFVMLGLCIISQITGNNNIAEKFASWALMYITVGLILSIIEMMKSE